MPIHHRIPGIIGQAISKYRGPAIAFTQSDKLVLNKAWTGFKHKSSIVGGIRTGLLGGSIVGSFINNAPDTPGNGPSIPFYGSETGSQDKARGGQTGRYNYRNRSSKRFNKYKRCTCARKHY